MTNREFFVSVVNANISDEITAFAEMSIKKLDDKNANRSSKNGDANKVIADKIVGAIEIGKIYTARELAVIGECSTQKIPAVIKLISNVEISDYTPTGKKKDTVKGYTFTE